MSDTKYVTAEGFVQFDPTTREAAGKTVTDFTIKTPGGDGKLVRITVWPELALPFAISKGDWIAVDGVFSLNTWKTKDGESRTTPQISANILVALPGSTTASREVVNSSKDDSKAPF